MLLGLFDGLLLPVEVANRQRTNVMLWITGRYDKQESLKRLLE
jgi:hypothetical protein